MQITLCDSGMLWQRASTHILDVVTHFLKQTTNDGCREQLARPVIIDYFDRISGFGNISSHGYLPGGKYHSRGKSRHFERL